MKAVPFGGVPGASREFPLVSLAVGVAFELCYDGDGGVARFPQSLG